MMVITLTDCPPALRGDLTKWLQEVNTGVYVGQVSARVRDEIWERVQEHAKSGRATMVYSANNEQKLDFRVHNTSWEPIDFDGVKLILRPSPARLQKKHELRTGFSNVSRMKMARKMSKRKHGRKLLPETYVVVDVETTGLSVTEHEIIEIGAVKVEEREIKSKFQALVKPKGNVPPAIEALTGISNMMLEREGRELVEVLPEFLVFVGSFPVVLHNSAFDFGFLRSACKQCGLPLFSNRCVDTLTLSRQLVGGVKNYQLETLLDHFGIKLGCIHRSIEDCLLTNELYGKLIELRPGEK